MADNPMLSAAIGPSLNDGDFPPSAWESFLQSVELYNERVALICVHQSDQLYEDRRSSSIESHSYSNGKSQLTKSSYLRWTYGTLRNRISRLTVALMGLGVEPGSGTMVVMVLPNGVEAVLLRYAANELGCKLLPLPDRALANPEELDYMLEMSLLAAGGGQRPVVAVADTQTAGVLRKMNAIKDKLPIMITVRVNEKETNSPHCLRFHELLAAPDPARGANGDRVSIPVLHREAHDFTVAFTSGTTARPKGILLAYPWLSDGFTEHRRRHTPPGVSFKTILTAATNTTLCYSWIAFTLGHGGTLVVPSGEFDVTAILRTVRLEPELDHLSLTPTAARLFAEEVWAAGIEKPLQGVKTAYLAGEVVNYGVIKLCIETLGICAVEMMYGFSESGCITGYRMHSLADWDVEGEDIPPVGWVLPGQHIKIVHPDTHQIVPRNMNGELHLTSISICRGYFTDEGPDSGFYIGEDDGKYWLRTGDQAKMGEDGRITITGRLKHIINRGGIKVSPAAIEATVAKHMELLWGEFCIVPMFDKVAGEVPVAVVRSRLDKSTEKAIKSCIYTRMGAGCVPADFVSVTDDLGLSKFPRIPTPSGKVDRRRLATLVDENRRRNGSKEREREVDGEVNGLMKGRHTLTACVVDTWAQALGFTTEQVPLTLSFKHFADSLTVVAIRDKVYQHTGLYTTTKAILDAGTIATHIELLKQEQTSRGSASATATFDRVLRLRTKVSSPLQDLQYLFPLESQFGTAKQLISRTLDAKNLNWDDVEDVCPSYDFMDVLGDWGSMNRMHFSYAAKSISVKEMQYGLEQMIENNRILSSLHLHDKASGLEEGLYIFIRRNCKYYKRMITSGGTLSLSDLSKLAHVFPCAHHASEPGPTFRAHIYEIPDIQGTGVAMCISHSVLDASTQNMLEEDLDEVLGQLVAARKNTQNGHQAENRQAITLPARIDYKLWLDMHHDLRTSGRATASVAWHRSYLEALINHPERHRKAIWPQMGFKQNRENDASASAPEEVKDQNIPVVFHCADLALLLKSRPELSSAAIVKAALALVLVNRTGHSHALFSNVEAGRWVLPFLPVGLEATGFLEASDVAGPTIQTVINLVEVNGGEKVLDFLDRVQRDAGLLSQHSTAPLRRTMEGIDRELMQSPVSFNWVPGMGQILLGKNRFANMERVAMATKIEGGLIVSAGVGGEDWSLFVLSLWGTALSRREMGELGEQLKTTTQWLIDQRNWDVPVDKVRNLL